MSCPLVACVVNHEGADKLSACLEGVRAQGDAIARVLVVDDASTDRGVALVRDRYPEMEVVELPVNRGPAAARNAGYRAADGARVLFVDNDVVLEPGCAARLARALDEDERAVIAMPRTVRAVDPSTIDFEGAGAHWSGQLVPEHAGDPVGPARPAREAGSLISSCFVIDRGRWGEEPPFDESFAFNYEDHELGLRCRLLGHRIVVVPAARCLHGTGTPGASVRGDAAYPALRVRSLIRGRWQILLVLYQIRTLVLLSPALALFELFQLAGAIRRGWVRPWLGAAAGVATSLPELLAKRRRVQRRRVLPDRELLVGGPLPFRRALAAGRVERGALSLLDAVVRAHVAVVRRLL